MKIEQALPALRKGNVYLQRDLDDRHVRIIKPLPFNRLVRLTYRDLLADNWEIIRSSGLGKEVRSCESNSGAESE